MPGDGGGENARLFDAIVEADAVVAVAAEEQARVVSSRGGNALGVPESRAGRDGRRNLVRQFALQPARSVAGTSKSPMSVRRNRMP